MKYTTLILSGLVASACARSDLYYLKRQHPRDVQAERGVYMRARWNSELQRREVPQEHSHEQFLTTVGTSLATNNPAGIKDPVFGLLGDAAGSAGQGSITDTDCLQQATADQAFTNAKAAGDVKGMTAALIYRALERNTGKVGLASVSCTSIKAVNPEIAAIQQHQDPASANAATTNKAITLELAKQIASIGGNATDALLSGTFAPGNVNDPTAKGNSCDDQNDAVGCIYTQNLLVEDATVDEINAAVAGVSSSNSASLGGASNVNSSVAAATGVSDGSVNAGATVTMMMTVTVTASDCSVASAPAQAAGDAGSQAGTNPSESSPVVTGEVAGQITAAPSASGSQSVSTGEDGTGEDAGSDTQSIDCGGQISSALSAAGMASATAAPPASTGTSSASGSASNSTSTSALDFGSCSNPTIIFANGLDGRNQPSFEPANTATFTHGSALNIKVITDFICQQLQSKCKASQATIDACNQGATAAQAATGQAAADAFNQALGF